MDEKIQFDIAQELGSLRASISAMQQIHKDHMEEEERDRKELIAFQQNLMARLTALENAALIRKGMVRLASLAMAAVGFFLTFKFGDIKLLMQLFR